MCFRPPDANVSKKCPACGAENDFMAKTCVECGVSLPDGPSGVPPAAGAPGAPKMPAAPGMPPAPGAPKAPGQ